MAYKEGSRRWGPAIDTSEPLASTRSLMKRSLRVTLLTVLLGLTTLTAGGIGLVAYVDARDTATDLTKQTLRETSKRIEHQVDGLVGIARRQVVLDQELLEMGFLDAD